MPSTRLAADRSPSPLGALAALALSLPLCAYEDGAGGGLDAAWRGEGSVRGDGVSVDGERYALDAAGSLAGRHFFSDARLGVDRDGSGEVEADETREVIGGTILFHGPVPDIGLVFDIVLENGTTARGGYRALFEFIDRR